MIGAGFVVLAGALAATPVSLEEVRAASREATTAQLRELDRLRAAEQVARTRAGLLPQVALSFQGQVAGAAPERRIVVNPLSGEELLVDVPGFVRPALALTLSANQAIFDPALWASLGVAEAQEQAASAQAAEERLTAELEGIRRFYELHRSEETYRVIETRVKNSAELAERADALFQAGRRRKEDAIAAQINLVNDQTALVRQRLQIAQASASLAAWIARPAAELLAAENPGLPAEPRTVPSFAQAWETARQERPQLRAMDALQRAAEEGTRSARALFLPTVGIGVAYSRVSSEDLRPFFNPLQQHTGAALFTVRWDVFNGFRNDTQVAQARIEERRAILNLEQARRDLEAELQVRVQNLGTAQEILQIAQANLRLAEENLALAEARFEEGAGSTLEIRDAQVKHTAAELQLIESRIDTGIARAALERTIGAFSPGVGT